MSVRVLVRFTGVPSCDRNVQALMDPPQRRHRRALAPRAPKARPYSWRICPSTAALFLYRPVMDMLGGKQVVGVQTLRQLSPVDQVSLGDLAEISEADDGIGHDLRVSLGPGHVDLELVSDDAIYRDAEGTEDVVEWVTQYDVDLARRITEIAADHRLAADPASVSELELGLDTARSATIAPVWAALLTGNPLAQGH